MLPVMGNMVAVTESQWQKVMCNTAHDRMAGDEMAGDKMADGKKFLLYKHATGRTVVRDGKPWYGTISRGVDRVPTGRHGTAR